MRVGTPCILLVIALGALGLICNGFQRGTWQRRLTRRINFLEASSTNGKSNYDLADMLQEDRRTIPVSTDGRREIINALNSVSGGFSGGGYGFLPFEPVLTRPVGLFDVINDNANSSPREITNKIKGYFAGIRLRSSSPDTLQQFRKYLQTHRETLDVVNALLLVRNPPCNIPFPYCNNHPISIPSQLPGNSHHNHIIISCYNHTLIPVSILSCVYHF